MHAKLEAARADLALMWHAATADPASTRYVFGWLALVVGLAALTALGMWLIVHDHVGAGVLVVALAHMLGWSVHTIAAGPPASSRARKRAGRE